MAFECGICYGALTFGTGRHKRKDLFVLDAEDHRYKKTMSDIAGQDADVHHNDPVKAIDCVRSFLARKSGVHPFRGQPTSLSATVASPMRCRVRRPPPE